MPTLDPEQAVRTCESAVRQLMRDVYSRRWGDQWITEVATPDQLKSWARNNAKDVAKRSGIVAQPAGPTLEGALFSDLLKVLEAHWEPVEQAIRSHDSEPDVLPLLHEFARLRQLLPHFEARRNAASHGRTLYPFETDLLSGIAGMVRNLVTIYTSAHDPDGDYYPRIDDAHDSLGHHITAITGADDDFLGVAPPIGERVDRLQPGAVITFTATATDPQDRDLEWSCTAGIMDDSVRKIAHSGATVNFTWTVGTDDVRPTGTQVILQIRSVNARYHRNGTQTYSYDHRAIFRYAVDRPEDDHLEVTKSLI